MKDARLRPRRAEVTRGVSKQDSPATGDSSALFYPILLPAPQGERSLVSISGYAEHHLRSPVEMNILL